jgi:riboflavin kinase/FMN adenylyltransferase
VWITSSLTTVLKPTVVALGNFDGIHQGHQRVICPVVKQLKPEGIAYSTLLTFTPHPKEFFSGRSHPLLTPLNEKVALLKTIGLEQLVLLPFNQDLARLSPEEFVEQILVEGLQAKAISVGQDFCFGQGRVGTVTDLQAIATGYGIQVAIAPLKALDQKRVSSSAIRAALLQGDIAQANRLLGRPYSLVGTVVQGQQLGRTLGFPTANLALPDNKFLPRHGVYAVWVASVAPAITSDERASALPSPVAGVMNLGYRPTVDGTRLAVEVHLLDWAGDLYGQTLVVNLEQFLRPEQKFDSLEALQTQIDQDCAAAKSLLASALS